MNVRTEKPVKLAILGARGIGKVHARIFHALGSDVYGILGSTAESVEKTADDLFSSFGFRPGAFHNLETLLSEPINAVCICTPPRLHFEQILAAFNKGLPVFCEKPLFWNEQLTANEVLEKTEQLRAHPQRRLFMNAPNALFLDALTDRFNSAHINTLKFSFYTNGTYKGIGIGMDLFTHGLSILYRIFGSQETSGFSWSATDATYSCRFTYGSCTVEFDFRQDPKGPKLFALSLNERIFTRIQEGAGATYNLYFHDSATDEKIKVEDPFNQSIQTFIDYCMQGSPVKKDNFEEAALIMKIMAKHLILPA